MMQIDEKFISAVAYSYLWIAASDNNISHIESSVFMTYIKSIIEGELQLVIDDNELMHLYDDAKDHFINNHEDAVNKARQLVKDFAGSTQAIKLIDTARKAIVADHQIKEGEEIVISEIASLLQIANP